MKTFDSFTILDIQKKLYYIDSHERASSGRRSELLKTFQRMLDRRSDEVIELARFGISRHFYYCDRHNIPYGIDAIREIIYDAIEGKCEVRSLQRELEQNKYSLPYNTSSVNFMTHLFQKSRSKGKTPVIA